GRPASSSATTSPSSRASSGARAGPRAASSGKATRASRPLALQARTPSGATSQRTRMPSHLTSYTQPGPVGSSPTTAFMGRTPVATGGSLRPRAARPPGRRSARASARRLVGGVGRPRLVVEGDDDVELVGPSHEVDPHAGRQLGVGQRGLEVGRAADGDVPEGGDEVAGPDAGPGRRAALGDGPHQGARALGEADRGAQALRDPTGGDADAEDPAPGL